LSYAPIFHPISDKRYWKEHNGPYILPFAATRHLHHQLIYEVPWMKGVKGKDAIGVVIESNLVTIRLGVPTYRHPHLSFGKYSYIIINQNLFCIRLIVRI